MGRAIRESSIGTRLGKSSQLGMFCSINREKGDVDLENQHRSLTTCIWVVLNENAKRAKILWTIKEKCSNPNSLQEPRKSCPILRNLAQTFLHGPIWKVMQRSCVERYCDLASRTTQQLYKVATPCLDDHQFKEEEMESVGELSKHAQKMF